MAENRSTDTTADGAPGTPPGKGGIPAPVVTIDIGGTIHTIAPPETPADPHPPIAPEAAPEPAHTSTVEAAPTAPPALTTTETAPAASAANTSAAEAAPAEPAVGSTETGATPPGKKAPASILAIDIGGTKVKILATGQTEPRKAPTGKGFAPGRLVETVQNLAQGWDYEAISIGYPGLVGAHGPRAEPGNLGAGWVGFDFAAAFGKPVKMVNDAAMQALGSYDGGRMLFLGLGTGLGSALIAGHVIVPLELGHILYDGDLTLSQVLGRRGFERTGKGPWRKAVNKVVTALMRAFVADYVVIGGGNAKNVKELPPGARLGHNLTAFRGGFRLWSVEDVWVLAAAGGDSPQLTEQGALRMR